MLKRSREVTSQSNIKGLERASAAHRSLQSFCNYEPPAVSRQLSAKTKGKKAPFALADG
jgi:hypothetical protein